jgi:micrococcal nuclease
MHHRHARTWLLALLVIAVVPAPGIAATPAPALQAAVLSWTDGDTVRVRTGSGVVRIRLIGIDAPETSPGERAARQARHLRGDTAVIIALGRKAKAAAERLAPPGTPVRVETDLQSHDRYGRRLAYLWLADGRMINEELVRQGWALALTIPPNVRYADRFVVAQREARRQRRGLWADRGNDRVAHSSSPTAPVVVALPVGFGIAAIAPAATAALAATAGWSAWRLAWGVSPLWRLWQAVLAAALVTIPLLLASGVHRQRPGAAVLVVMLCFSILLARQRPRAGLLLVPLLLVFPWRVVWPPAAVAGDVAAFVASLVHTPGSLAAGVFLGGMAAATGWTLALRRRGVSSP